LEVVAVHYERVHAGRSSRSGSGRVLVVLGRPTGATAAVTAGLGPAATGRGGRSRSVVQHVKLSPGGGRGGQHESRIATTVALILLLLLLLLMLLLLLVVEVVLLLQLMLLLVQLVLVVLFHCRLLSGVDATVLG